MAFQFGNVVVVEGNEIGVIVKSWEDRSHDVYLRSYSSIVCYKENQIKHYVYSKQLHESEEGLYHD